MGIYDRDYVRREPPRRGSGLGSMRLISVNAWLIIVNSAIFFFGAMLPRTYALPSFQPMDALQYYGHFSTLTLFHLEVWRLITFQFLHANLMHLVFNMFGLWVFGSMVEQTLGSRKYLAFYLVCGIFGGLMYLFLNLLGALGINVPGALGNTAAVTPLIGASAGVFGVIMACAYISPNSIVQLLFPPVALRLKWMAYGYVGLALFNLLSQGRNAGGDAAHIGGALAGFFFVRNHHLLGDFFDVFKDSRRSAATAPSRRRVGPAPPSPEIDRILQKVFAQGLSSLTESERRVLHKDTQRRRRRGA